MLRFANEEWPYYDGIPDRDPSRLLPDDVLATVAMNAFPYSATATKIRTIHQGLARACDRLLAEIPADVDIRTFDLDNTHAKALFEAACGVRGVLLPVATKVLHRKRPGWLPMLDTVVNHGYLDTLGKQGLKARLEDGSRGCRSRCLSDRLVSTRPQRRGRSTRRVVADAGRRRYADVERADPRSSCLACPRAAGLLPVAAGRDPRWGSTWREAEQIGFTWTA